MAAAPNLKVTATIRDTMLSPTIRNALNVGCTVTTIFPGLSQAQRTMWFRWRWIGAQKAAEKMPKEQMAKDKIAKAETAKEEIAKA